MIQKIYKNTDLLFSIEIGDNNNIIDIADIGELTMLFYTDSTPVEKHIIITKDDIINSNQIFIDNSKLDLLNEGLLKYNIKLRFNNTNIDEPFDIAKTVETEYFIKNDNFNDGSSCTGGTVDSYSKSEIDLKLSLKANVSDIFNKSEVNEKLADKANKSDLPDTSILATKDELNLKANKSDVYSKVEIDAKFNDIEPVDLTNYYTKVEVDEKIADAGTVDLSNYYKKAEVDNKLTTKVDAVEGKQLSANDYTDADKSKLQSLNNYDDTSIKQSLSTKADINNVYSKSEVDKKIDDAVTGEIDLSDYYKKVEIDSKLAEKTDISAMATMATKTELAGKADISAIAELATKTELAAKANVADVYTKSEVNDLIDNIETSGSTVDLTNYYKKNEIDSKLATKADTSAMATMATKTELATKANSSDVYMKSQTYSKIEVDDLIAGTGGTGGTTDTYSKSEIDLKLSLKADSANTYSRSELYTRAQIDTKLADKTDVSRTSVLEVELNKKANSDDVYTKSEVDDLIAGTGGTGGTVTSSEVYILRWNKTQATEEHAQLYTKLYESFWYNNTVSVLFNVLDGTDEYIIDVNNIYKDNSATRNEIKLSGSYILSSSIFHVEIVLKKDGSFTFTKNNITINNLADLTTIENRLSTLESEIKNPSEMTVDCSKF